jgi:hypothetical protein
MGELERRHVVGRLRWRCGVKIQFADLFSAERLKPSKQVCAMSS